MILEQTLVGLPHEQENTSKTLEVRLSHSGEKVSWTAGAFYMESDEVWDFVSYVDGYANSPAFATWSDIRCLL